MLKGKGLLKAEILIMAVTCVRKVTENNKVK
jgi:hypothetical protein